MSVLAQLLVVEEVKLGGEDVEEAEEDAPLLDEADDEEAGGVVWI